MADDKALTLVQEDRHLDFNRYVETLGKGADLSGGQFRGYDLRRFNLQGANLTNAYLKHADIRGLDLSEATLQGASMREAKVSGTLFPESLSPSEIRLSLEFGTRLRQQKAL